MTTSLSSPTTSLAPPGLDLDDEALGPFSTDSPVDLSGDLCPWCGEPAYVDLLDIFPEERSWLFDTCCEAFHAELLDDIESSPATPPWLLTLLRTYGLPARAVFVDCDHLQISYRLRLARISLKRARAFVERHHRHHPPPLGWRWGHAVFNGGELIGVATVGRPVARALDPDLVVEVNRLCIVDSRPRELTVNAASMLYAAAAREARRRGYRDIITYTLASERGVSLLAAGWTRDGATRGGSWSTPARQRDSSAPTCPKIRWRKILRRPSSLGPLQLCLR